MLFSARSSPSRAPSPMGVPSGVRRRLKTLWMTFSECWPDASAASSAMIAHGTRGNVTSKLMRMFLFVTATPSREPPAAASSTSMCSTASTARKTRSSVKKSAAATASATSDTAAPVRVRSA